MATNAATYQKVFVNALAAVNTYYRPRKLDTRDALMPYGNLVPYKGKGPFSNSIMKNFRTSLGDTQQEMLNRLGNDPSKFLQKVVSCVQTVPIDDIPVNEYAWASDDGPLSHYYCVGIRNKIHNVDDALKADGQIFLRDFGNFYEWNGLLQISDPRSQELLKEYNSLKNSAARRKWLAQNRDKFMGSYDTLRDNKKMLSPGDCFFMGENLVEFKAAGWFETVDAQGKKLRTFAALLCPGPTHSFAGWIVHGYQAREDGIIESWVMGGGSAYVPGQDWANTLLGSRMWSVTKQWTVEQINHEQMKRAGKVPLHATFVGYVATYRPELMRASMYFGKAVGMGGPVGIWLNRLTGRREPVTLDPTQKIEIRDDLFRDPNSEDWMLDAPYGTRDFQGNIVTTNRQAGELDIVSSYFLEG